MQNEEVIHIIETGVTGGRCFVQNKPLLPPPQKKFRKGFAGKKRFLKEKSKLWISCFKKTEETCFRSLP